MQTKAQRFPHNYLFLMLEGACFMGGLGFFSANTVIPVFIDFMTGSKVLVGLTISIGSFLMYLGRILVGPFVPHLRNHARFTAVVLFLSRPVTLLPGLLLMMGMKVPSLIALMVAYWFLWIADGLVVPTWSEVMATTVEESRHGRLLGSQQFIGGLLSIGAGILINRLLAGPAASLGQSFAIVFLIGGVLMVTSCVLMAMAEGAPHEPKRGKVDFHGYFRGLPRLFAEERDNSRVLVLQLLLSVSLMCLPFIILLAVDTAGLPEGSTATLILLQTLGLPIGGWLWGQICDHVGITAGLKLAAANVLLVAGIPLVAVLAAGHAPMLFQVLLGMTMLLGGISNGIWTMSFLYTVQAVRPASRPSCIVLASFVAMPASFAGALAGFITDRFGYAPLFVLCVLLGLVALGMTLTVRPVAVVVAEREAAEPPQSMLR